LLDIGRQLAHEPPRWLLGLNLALLGDSGLSALVFLDDAPRPHHGRPRPAD
jgi:hypothetical protein